MKILSNNIKKNLINPSPKNSLIITLFLSPQRDIAIRELQDLNTLALQRMTEFTIRHFEAEAYVKKLLAERKIELPCTYYLRQQATPISSSRCESVASKSSSRVSLIPSQPQSSRESAISAGSVVHFEPDFSGECGSGGCWS